MSAKYYRDEAIIDPELWRIVQDKLAVNRHEHSLAVGAEAPSLLAGLIVDADGNRMTPTHATKRAKRYRYYVSVSLLTGDRPQTKKGMRVPAGDIEALVLDRLRAFFSSRIEVSDALAPLDLDACTLDGALQRIQAFRGMARRAARRLMPRTMQNNRAKATAIVQFWCGGIAFRKEFPP